MTRAEEIAQEKLPEIITAARAFGADKAIEIFAAVLREYANEKGDRVKQIAKRHMSGLEYASFAAELTRIQEAVTETPGKGAE